MTVPIMQPGGEQERRPLQVIFLLDCSSSMQGEKIAALNSAIKDVLPALKDADEKTVEGRLQMRSIGFGSGAWWHIAKPTDIADVVWTDLPANGVTDLGRALGLLDQGLDRESLGTHFLPPVLILVSDGQPTDSWMQPLAKLKSNRYWKHCVRLAIAIGQDAAHAPLKAFIDHPELEVLQADNARALGQYIRWSTTRVTESMRNSKTDGSGELSPQDEAAKAQQDMGAPVAGLVWPAN